MQSRMTDVGQQLGAIVQRLDDLKEDVSEIKKQTTKTNGRVTTLETVNAIRAEREAQRQRFLRWVIWGLGLIVAVFSGTLGALILGVH